MRYVRRVVAVVIADNQQQARDAAEAVEVDYSALPAVSQPLDALTEGAPQIHENAPGNLIFDWEIDFYADHKVARLRRLGLRARWISVSLCGLSS